MIEKGINFKPGDISAQLKNVRSNHPSGEWFEVMCLRAADEIASLTAERDEARREVCLWQGLDTNTKPDEVAQIRGWDCFKEDGK